MLARHSGSFRDPAGYVYELDDRIFRVVSAEGAVEYEAARDAGLLEWLVNREHLVPFIETPPDQFGPAAVTANYLLEHPRLQFISYPYEWSFSLLRDAALFHLDLHLELLGRGFTLSDASAFNVQFEGPNPIFIDHLSFRRYREGEYWVGHRQFCEQFLNPLLLRALFGIAHNAWYRGSPEGIPTADLAKLMSLRHKLSWRLLTHVVLPYRFQQQAMARKEEGIGPPQRPLPLSGYTAMLRQLRTWIASVTSERTGATTWGEYAKSNTYAGSEEAHKKQFVSDFIRLSGAKMVIDLGCNTGEYAHVALRSGATHVVGFDSDPVALDEAHILAKNAGLNFTPLFLDARNPSPDQGWRQDERAGLTTRAKADAVLALAFEHHLSVAHNVPLDQVIEWIVGFAPTGVVEFVPKTDPTVRRMLSLREDIFPHYTEENFSRILGGLRTIVRREVISESGRVLFLFVS
jgi:ribosomal protein L11 methylase PrmA